MREVMLIALVAALGAYFMTHPREFYDLLNWITQLAR
jgi:hypothetical protein